MANTLKTEQKTQAISLLCEGSSIRSIERITGVHRDTIMRLGVRVGQACAKIQDEKMRGLTCKQVEVDEIWGLLARNGRTRPAPEPTATFGRSSLWTLIRS